jgi:hypothetical protein
MSSRRKRGFFVAGSDQKYVVTVPSVFPFFMFYTVTTNK